MRKDVEQAVEQLIERVRALLDTALRSPRPLTEADRTTAGHAAERLHRHAVDLCMDRATEFSPKIGECFDLAARLALVAHGPGTTEAARYAKDASDADALSAFEAALARGRPPG